MRRIKSLCILLACFMAPAACLPLAAQYNYSTSQGDLIIGITADLGMPINRIGLLFGGNYRSGFLQFNQRTVITFGLTGLGPKGKYVDAQLSFGALAAFGPKDLSKQNYFFHALSNQTGQANSIAYAFNLFLDNKQTSQNTGAIALQFSAVEIIFDNDILAFKGRDKYRTGAVQIAYRREQYRAAVELITWTGNSQVKECKRIRESEYPAKNGYMDMANAVFGNISHGILAVNFQYAYNMSIVPGIRLGVDAEQVRHLFQNKFIHDMPFVPVKWMKVENPHIPMVDIEGNPYLYLEGQEVRRIKPVIQALFNSSYY